MQEARAHGFCRACRRVLGGESSVEGRGWARGRSWYQGFLRAQRTSQGQGWGLAGRESVKPVGESHLSGPGVCVSDSEEERPDPAEAGFSHVPICRRQSRPPRHSVVRALLHESPCGFRRWLQCRVSCPHWAQEEEGGKGTEAAGKPQPPLLFERLRHSSCAGRLTQRAVRSYGFSMFVQLCKHHQHLSLQHL